jgi:hypothetical protein
MVEIPRHSIFLMAFLINVAHVVVFIATLVLGAIFFDMLFNDKKLPLAKPVYGSYDILLAGGLFALFAWLSLVL